MINYSFIIPHKNTPELLQKCIDSIPHREDVQIIVVDDNSDTDKVDFEHFPGFDDPQVEVYLTKEGRGAGYARNVGLSRAVGKWIIFADADDYFTPSIQEVLNNYCSDNSDIIIWKTSCINIENEEPGLRGSALNTAIDKAIKSGKVDDVLLISTPIKGLYSHKLLAENNIKFNECRWANDVVFSSRVAAVCSTVKFITSPIYIITEHPTFGLISKPTFDSHRVRYTQECESVSLLKKTRFKNNDSIYYWCFRSWFDIYKKFGLWKALILLPMALNSCGKHFIAQLIDVVYQKI